MRLAPFILIGIFTSIIIAVQPSFAQQANGSNATISQNSTSLNTSQNTVPVLEKLSDKGHYMVQLKLDASALNQTGEFNMQVLFLNASSPHTNSTNFPQKEGGIIGYSSAPNKTATENNFIVDNVIAVDHYDIAILDNSGKVLYQKTDQPGQASSGGVSASIGNYTGPLTIAITNITAAIPFGSTTPASNNSLQTDSVKFSTTVAPEFPLGTIALAAALSSAVAIWRIKRRATSRRDPSEH